MDETKYQLPEGVSSAPNINQGIFVDKTSDTIRWSFVQWLKIVLGPAILIWILIPAIQTELKWLIIGGCMYLLLENTVGIYQRYWIYRYYGEWGGPWGPVVSAKFLYSINTKERFLACERLQHFLGYKPLHQYWLEILLDDKTVTYVMVTPNTFNQYQKHVNDLDIRVKSPSTNPPQHQLNHPHINHRLLIPRLHLILFS